MSSSQPGNRGRVSAAKYLLCDMTRPKLITEVALGSEPNASSDSSGQLDHEQLHHQRDLTSCYSYQKHTETRGGGMKASNVSSTVPFSA